MTTEYPNSLTCPLHNLLAELGGYIKTTKQLAAWKVLAESLDTKAICTVSGTVQTDEEHRDSLGWLVDPHLTTTEALAVARINGE